MQETWVWSLSQEDPLEKEMATHTSILAWEIPWTEDPGRLEVHRVTKSQMWLSTHRIAACDYAKQCGGLKQRYVNYHNFMGCLGSSHSRCLTLSFKDATGLAIQAGALTWADAEASCWREMSRGLWLQYLCAAFQETWLSFLTAWQLVSERECLGVSFLRDPSRGFFYILRPSYILVWEVPAWLCHLKPVPWITHVQGERN